jgi:hypothetical protein
MTKSMQCLFIIFAFVLFIIALYFGNYAQFQPASIGFCLAGSVALVAAAITTKKSN